MPSFVLDKYLKNITKWISILLNSKVNPKTMGFDVFSELSLGPYKIANIDFAKNRY